MVGAALLAVPENPTLFLRPKIIYPITLPNGLVVTPSYSVDYSTLEGMESFESSPHNKVGFSYYDKVFSKICWIAVHSGGRKQKLPGDALVRYESSFYRNPIMKFGNQSLRVNDIQVLNVQNVLDNPEEYDHLLLDTATRMRGHNNIFQTCYPPYRNDGKGFVVGDNVLLIAASRYK